MKSSLGAVTAACILISLGAAGCGSSDPEPEPVAADVPAGFFGVVPQAGIGQEDIERMAQGNVGTIRLVVPWGLIDTTAEPDDLNFSYVDTVVLIAAANGIQVLPTIYGTPTWVAEGLDGEKCDPDCASFGPRSDAAIEAWRSFVGRIVERYGPEGEIWAEHPEIAKRPIRSWQIWNEQNSPTFYQPKVDPAAYQKLLAAASDAIHSRDEDAEVILGGMFGTPYQGKPPAMSAPDFLRDLYEIDGAASDFDAVAAHPYARSDTKIELQVRLLHEEVERAKDDARMWITEAGASSDEGDNPLELGTEGQAEQLQSSFEFFLDRRDAWKIEGVTWYSWRDVNDPNQCEWCPGSGLFYEDDLTPKPAWETFVAFTGGS
jgi:hypothetical protein